MRTCCGAHLAAMVRDLIPNAENGAVTVNSVKNSFKRFIHADIVSSSCDYCGAPAEFDISYYQESPKEYLTKLERLATSGEGKDIPT